MSAQTNISQQTWTPRGEAGNAAAPHNSHRVLVVTDGSAAAGQADGAHAQADAARAGFALGHDWTATFGADICAMEVSEHHDRRHPRAHDGAAGDHGRAGAGAGAGATRARRVEVHGWTLGARTRRLASEITAAAESCGADVIVLGMDRRRLARRHLIPSLRDQLASATALPVLVAPSTAPVADYTASVSGADVPARARSRPTARVEGYARV
jgi:nucleotide-binding universal stress UspA family protein